MVTGILAEAWENSGWQQARGALPATWKWPPTPAVAAPRRLKNGALGDGSAPESREGKLPPPLVVPGLRGFSANNKAPFQRRRACPCGGTFPSGVFSCPKCRQRIRLPGRGSPAHTPCVTSARGPWPVTSSGESTRKKNEGMMEIKQLVLQCALEKGDWTALASPCRLAFPSSRNSLLGGRDDTDGDDLSRVTATGGLTT